MYYSPDKRARFGALLWIASVQYFIVQLVVISAWTVPHSLANNFISDLGNTECGMYAGLLVCSPLHLLMNYSFVIFGMTIAIGAMLLMAEFRQTKLLMIGWGLMILCGVGTVLVGLFPENTIGQLHILGAVLGLGVGNLGVLLLGLGLKHINPVMRQLTIMSALISLSAFVLFVSNTYLGLGRGGMERVISYTFTVWMIVFGGYILCRGRSFRNT